MELLCQEGIKPSVIVTNDWPAGLVAAYNKDGKFGPYFNDSKFFHVLHNADSSHEGRIYPETQDDFRYIHDLPHDYLVNSYWSEFIINPTRCGVYCSDNWGTVS